MSSRHGHTAVVCGIDVGSTNTKVIALDHAGRVLGRAARPTPRMAGEQSIDADSLFHTIEEMTERVCTQSRLVISAAAAAGVGEDGVLVDVATTPLTPALAWFDPRRQRIFNTLRPSLHDDESFGVVTDPSRSIVGWAWACAQPTTGHASSWVALTDYPGARWTGRPFMSDTLAARTAAWRVASASWDPSRVRLALGSTSLLPDVVTSGEVVGPLDSAALRHAGVLAGDAVVVAGEHDHPVGWWGVNTMSPGAVLDSMGTAEVVVAGSGLQAPPPGSHVDSAPGILAPGRTVLRVEEIARNVAWASQDPDVADAIHRILAGRAQPNSALQSDDFCPGERGGGRPRYLLTAAADPESRASAVLGALARRGADAIDAVSHTRGPRAGQEVWLAGGWARSPGWVAIKSAITPRPLHTVGETEVTAVGAALLAAAALGWDVDAGAALSGRGDAAPTLG